MEFVVVSANCRFEQSAAYQPVSHWKPLRANLRQFSIKPRIVNKNR